MGYFRGTYCTTIIICYTNIICYSKNCERDFKFAWVNNHFVIRKPFNCFIGFDFWFFHQQCNRFFKRLQSIIIRKFVDRRFSDAKKKKRKKEKSPKKLLRMIGLTIESCGALKSIFSKSSRINIFQSIAIKFIYREFCDYYVKKH